MILGSSFIRRLDQHLKRHQVPVPPHVKLVGQSGLRLNQTKHLIDQYLKQDGYGDIVLHVGANDVGCLNEYDWIMELEEHIMYIKLRYPDYRVFWSDMTPRKSYRYGSKKVMEIKRKRSQRRARRLFFREGNGVIHHPVLQRNDSLIHSDGVHFTELGQSVFWHDFCTFFEW